MVQAYWADFMLSIPTLATIVELLFKIGEQSFLKNWRPISLITLTYKIIAKILANHLQSYAPRLIDPQQTGFVKGHSIQENFMALKFSQEFVRRYRLPAFLLKLDFVKAYDRLKHIFLLETMATMGFA